LDLKTKIVQCSESIVYSLLISSEIGGYILVYSSITGIIALLGDCR